ncbi:Ntn hydrolase family protein [Desulfosoma caldarium]|uniref:20S proteasome alpha/beta subunit n=1 Tax=Desulfosoma caldarium TaxID=610254 RepID=A0A3N1UET7_9BACT|nr:hypothetical protein [Desulfosoma caldarium]ROQ89885.1 20S proteasome alpha/beta subunit [Desulfosoma caldarium]
MSQIIACQTKEGIVLAVDAKAVDVDTQGNVIHSTVEWLHPLGPRAAVAAGGAPEGAEMARLLSRFVADEKLEDIADIYPAALSFLASQFNEFRRKMCRVVPLDPIHQVYFLLAGVSAQDPENPQKLYLVWTKKKQPQLDGEEIRHAFTVPRRMALEYRLSQMAQRGATVQDVLTEVRAAMESLTWYKEEVGPPYRFAVLSKEGFREVPPS